MLAAAKSAVRVLGAFRATVIGASMGAAVAIERIGEVDALSSELAHSVG